MVDEAVGIEIKDGFVRIIADGFAQQVHVLHIDDLAAIKVTGDRPSVQHTNRHSGDGRVMNRIKYSILKLSCAVESGRWNVTETAVFVQVQFSVLDIRNQ